MDRNDVYLQGRIGQNLKYGKTERGSEYATFSLVIEPVQNKQDKGSEATTYIRILVFEKHLVKYLHDVKAKEGQRVAIVAFINSRRTEVKGETIIQNSVIARDIIVAKTKQMKISAEE